MKINVGSWNIWIYGSRDYRGIAELIKENNIDIIGIQEAGIYTDRGKENMAELIARELGFEYALYLTGDILHKGYYKIGNAVLSKFPIMESKCHLLNPKSLKYDKTCQTESRILVSSKIDVNGRMLNFLTTHLQFSPMFKTTDLRLRQVDKIITVLNGLEVPQILTGDFNSVPQNEEIRNIERTMNRLGNDEPTWTVYPFNAKEWKVDEMKYRIDNIFASSDIKCKEFKVIESRISDHLPIMSTLDI